MGRVLPILFNTEMVRAVLDGRKTVTRRCVKGFIPNDAIWGYTMFTPKGQISCRGYFADEYGEKFFKLPYQPGDILYVRETWGKGYEEGTYIYRADDKLAELPMFKESSKMIYRPSIFMPKEAARIWLKVTSVSVERLQDITEEQAEKEGIPDGNDYPIDKVYCPTCKGMGFIGGYNPESLGFEEIECPDCYTAIKRFRNLWNSTIRKSDIDRYGWEANPWVWVIDFERCERPV